MAVPNLDIEMHPRQALVFQSPAEEILYGGAAGGGKALSLETLIVTPTGWTTMEEVEVGDKVFGGNGEVCDVVAVSDISYGRPCFKVVFSDNTEIIADANHQWLISTAASRQTERRQVKSRINKLLGKSAKGGIITSPSQIRSQAYKLKSDEVMTTEQLHNKGVRHSKQGGRRNYSVRVAGSLELPDVELPLDPYVLGAWLGDGSDGGCLHICEDDEPIAEELRKRGFDLTKRRNKIGYYVKMLTPKLRELGVGGNKHIPTKYMRASFFQRLELLRGLMDTDGCCTKDKKCSFSNTNKTLTDQVYELACSLGIKPRKRDHNKEGYSEKFGYNRSNSWEIYFSASLYVFHNPRKRANQNTLERLTNFHRYIVSIEPVESVPVKCIQVNSPDHTYLISKSFIPTHNSHLARIAAIIWACQIPGLQVYFFRRQFVDIELNHLNGPKSFLSLLAPLRDTGHCQWNKGKYQFSFWNGSSIKLAHVQKDTDMWNYLGAEMHVMIVDELSQFTAQIYKFLRSRLRMIGIKVPDGVVGNFPRILCCSNPGGPAHSFMKMSWINSHPPETVWRAEDEDGGLLRQFIPAKIKDNPSLLEDDPNYHKRLQGLGDPAMVKAYLEGSFDILSGGMFDDLWRYDTHVVQPFPVPWSWHVNRAFDMGTARPFCVSWFAESNGERVVLGNGRVIDYPRGTLFQIGEWYGWNGQPNEGCRMVPSDIARGIKSVEAKFGRKIYPGPADSSIYDSDAYGTSVASVMSNEGVEWIPADKRPGTRIAGWRQIRQRLSSAVTDPKELPGLYFFPNCVHTIRTLSEAVRKRTDPEDIDTNSEDHALDTLRYLILSGNSTIDTGGFRAF